MMKLTQGYFSDEPMPGTEQWVEVADLSANMSYEWNELHAYYSPETRMFYWGAGSGCSCNDWMDRFNKASDFTVGTKEQLLNAIREYHELAKDEWSGFTMDKVNVAIMQVSSFKEYRGN